MSFRKEKKYRVTPSDYFQFQQHLISQGMTKLFEDRKINSLYFDTDNLSMYYDSEEGILPRKKIRIRWYADITNCTKEIKISSEEGRFKTTEKISQEAITEDTLLKIRYFDDQYGSLLPSLLVRYSRSYFTLKDLRITFDRQISYANPRAQLMNCKHDEERVMEVKVPIDCDDDYIEKIIPYPTARFSKYSRGLLMFDRML